MKKEQIMRVLNDTAYVHTSGTDEELRAANYLLDRCTEMGVSAHLEAFPVPMGRVTKVSCTADGEEVVCTGYALCGDAAVEAPFYYLPSTDPVSMADVKGKIVMVDTGMTHFLFQDLYEKGAVGFITYNGSVFLPDNDIDIKELRPVVSCGKKLPGVNVHARTAAKLVAMAPKTVRIEIANEEWDGESHNVVAEIPGEKDEYIVLTAHYDTVPLSVGSYDNMTGCVALLGIMEALKDRKLTYGLRFVFCGSEERGLLGSKAYVRDHKDQLSAFALNINFDMVGTIMGRFIACVSAEERLNHFIEYFAALEGFGIKVRTGVYSSDSTPFADAGVPALSFARVTPPSQSTIHNRYDTIAVLSADQLARDIDFAAAFTACLASAKVFPVSRAMPDKVKNDLDEYLLRKRKPD